MHKRESLVRRSTSLGKVEIQEILYVKVWLGESMDYRPAQEQENSTEPNATVSYAERREVVENSESGNHHLDTDIPGDPQDVVEESDAVPSDDGAPASLSSTGQHQTVDTNGLGLENSLSGVPQHVSPESSLSNLQSADECMEMDDSVQEQAGTVADDTDTAPPRVSAHQRVGVNHGDIIGVQYLQQIVRRLIGPHRLADEFIEECLDSYVEPGKCDKARDTLHNRRVLVLPGVDSIGRHTSAVWLLNRLGNLTLRGVRHEPDDEFSVDELTLRRRTGWILDLSEEDDEIPEGLGRHLASPDAKEMLINAESYLVVIIRANLWESVGFGGDSLAVELQAPSAVEIIEQRLTKSQLYRRTLTENETRVWLESPKIARHVTSLGPKQAVKWAETIRSVHDMACAEADAGERDRQSTEELVKQHVDTVVAARNNWHDHLLEWHRNHADSRLRNFLLATAVLHGRPAGEIFQASKSLSEKFGEPDANPPGQTGPGIMQLAADTGATIHADKTIDFEFEEYTQAVIEYFWTDRIPLQAAFIQWMSKLPMSNRDKDVDASIAGRIGEYVLRWCEQHDDLDMLKRVVIAWSAEEQLVPAASELVTAASLDPLLGKKMRDEMLTWARKGELGQRRVVAHACRGILGQHYPKRMLFRLGALAGSDDPKVRQDVQEAVGALWEQTNVRSQIKRSIVQWCNDSRPAFQAAGRQTFLSLARLAGSKEADYRVPQLLQDLDRDFLTDGWRAVFEDAPRGGPSYAVFRAWMDATLTSENVREALVRIFVSVVRGDQGKEFSAPRKIAVINHLYDWQPTSSADIRGIEVRDRLTELIAEQDPVVSDRQTQ